MFSSGMGMLSLGADMLGGILAGNAAKQGAQAYRYEANIFEKEAGVARFQGEAGATTIRRGAASLLGEQKSAYAGAGLLMEGSPLVVMKKSAMNAEYDAMMAKYQGELEAERLQEQAEVSRMSAKAIEDAADRKKTGGLIGGIGGLLIAGPWGGIIGYAAGSGS